MDPHAPRALVLTGPTGSGKSGLSLALARRLDAEIVSMDSRQVYRGLDVGTAKVSLADRARAPHHGLDLLDPDRRYSAGRFGRDARRWIREIEGRGRLPLLVGGTGFFLRALTDPVFREPDMDPGRRRRLRRILGGWTAEKLEAWVRVLDPDRAEVAAAGGGQRMARTLEVALLTGRPLSWWHAHGRPEAPPLRCRVVVVTLPREELDRRIEDRARRMVREGLPEEVGRLLDAGYGPEDPGLSGVGYREMVSHLRGESTLEEALESMQRATRRYARRQLTWFRNQLEGDPGVVEVLELDGTATVEEQVEVVLGFWRGPGAPDGDR